MFQVTAGTTFVCWYDLRPRSSAESVSVTVRPPVTALRERVDRGISYVVFINRLSYTDRGIYKQALQFNWQQCVYCPSGPVL